MVQAYEEILEMEAVEIEEPEVQAPIKSEVDELLGDLNPRYFEETINLKEAKRRAYASNINGGSKFNFFTPY